jgi:WhiB family redox-sensing transcriptional regulator
VLQQCRDHALLMHEPYGVWGGLTPRERNILLQHPEAATSRVG